MDIIGLILVMVCVATSLAALKISYTTYKNFGTTFYRYLTIAFFCFTLMPLGYFFQIFIVDSTQYLLVLTGTLSFNVWAYGGLACIVGGVEYLKDHPSSLRIDIAFFLAGLLVAGRFLPTFQEMVFNGESWDMTFRDPLMFIFGLFYLYVGLTTLPFLLRLWYRVKRGGSFGYITRILYLGAIFSMMYSAIVLVLNRGESESNPFFLHNQAYLIFSILGILFITILIRRSPTIFFSTTDDLIYLGLVRSQDNISLLGYKFGSYDIDVLSYLVTGVHDTLNTILQEAIRSTEELKQMRIGRDVITLVKGRYVTGFIISDREIEILSPLLIYIVDMFERKYGHEVFARHDFPEFRIEVERVFQFALMNKVQQGWWNLPKFLKKV